MISRLLRRPPKKTLSLRNCRGGRSHSFFGPRRSAVAAAYVTAASYLLRERVIFASAYPILPLKEARQAYEQSGMRPEALPLLMGGNAARFLHRE